MFGRFMPREGKFFDLFQKCADSIVEATYEFRKLVANPTQIDSHAKRIKDIEHIADEITHEAVELLHKTFVTPIDRDDIYELVSRLDDILDFLEAASQRIVLYRLKKITPEIGELAEVCVQSAEHVRKAVFELSNLKNSKDILRHCVEINRLENEGDQILRAAMAKLFRDEPDTRELIKLKEIYELLESVTDRCEDVANTIEGIVLEYA